MSKNLRGLSGSSVTINLLDIDANSVTATTGTFTDIIATNYSINNVSINNLIVSGVVRLTGIVDAPVALLPEHEILIKDPNTNLVYKFSSLVFNAGTGSLKSPDIITATMTVGDIYVTGILTLAGSMPALQVTGQTDLGTGLSIQSLAQVNSGLNIAYGLTLWNSTTADLSHDITKLYYNKFNETLYAPNISVTNFNIIPVTRNTNIEYPMIFFDDDDEKLAIDGSTPNTFTYNPGSNRLTARELRATLELYAQDRLRVGGTVTFQNLDITLSNKEYSIMLCEKLGGEVTVDSTKLYYDTTDDTVYSENVDISGTLTVNCPNTVQLSNNRLCFIEAFNDGVNPIDYSKGVLSKSDDLYFNHSFRTLYAYNMRMGNGLNCRGSAIFADDCTIESSNDLKFLELDATLSGDKGMIYSENIGRFIFRRSSTLDPIVQLVNEQARANGISGLFQIQLSPVDVDFNVVSNGSIKSRINGNTRLTLDNTKFLVDTDFETTGQTSITATTSANSNNNKILFVEGGTSTGEISVGSGSFYYNPSNQTVVSQNVLGTSSVASDNVRVTATGVTTAILNVNSNVGLRLNHDVGVGCRINSVNQFLVGTAETNAYNPFLINDTCEIAYKPALASETRNMRVLISDTGTTDKTVKQHNNFIFNPSTETLSLPNLTATALTTTSLTATALTLTTGAGSNGNCTLIIESDTDNAVETASPQLNLKKDGGNCGYFIKGGNETDSGATGGAENNLIFKIADTTGTPNAFYFQDDTTELLKLSTGGATISGDLDAVNATVTGLQVTTNNIIFDSVIYSSINADLPLLFLDNRSNGDNKIRQRDTDLTYNAGQQILTTTNATVTGLLTYGQLPVNYVQSIAGLTGSYVLTSNMWGQNKQILFSTSVLLYSMKTYAANIRAWNKSSGVTGNFSLSSPDYNGLWQWHVVIEAQYNTTNGNARLNPKIYVERTRGSTVTRCIMGEGVYWRGANRARQVSVPLEGVVDCLSTDVFKIKTLCNLGQNTGFANQSTAFQEQTFTIDWQYLGPNVSTFAQTW